MSLEDKLQQASGAAKEVLGKVTGDKSTETEGAVEKGLGKAKEVIENVKEEPLQNVVALFLYKIYSASKRSNSRISIPRFNSILMWPALVHNSTSAV